MGLFNMLVPCPIFSHSAMGKHHGPQDARSAIADHTYGICWSALINRTSVSDTAYCVGVLYVVTFIR